MPGKFVYMGIKIIDPVRSPVVLYGKPNKKAILPAALF